MPLVCPEIVQQACQQVPVRVSTQDRHLDHKAVGGEGRCCQESDSVWPVDWTGGLEPQPEEGELDQMGLEQQVKDHE